MARSQPTTTRADRHGAESITGRFARFGNPSPAALQRRRAGSRLAHPPIGMMRREVDERPGALPGIRTDGDSVVCQLAVANGGGITSRLVIRCDANGEVWASIESLNAPPNPSSLSQN